MAESDCDPARHRFAAPPRPARRPRGARPIAYLNHAEEGPDFVQDESSRAEASRLRAAISTLPPRQREAIEILGLREQTLAEASRDTGSSKVALKVNFFRALKSLRTRLGSNADV